MPDEGSQLDDTNIPPPLAVQQQEEERRKQEEQRRQLQMQAVQNQGKQVAAKKVESKVANKIWLWIAEVAIPVFVETWYIWATIIVIGLAVAIIGYVFSGRNGSIPGATISMDNPAHAQLMNQLLALNGNQQAIAKFLGEKSAEMKKAVDEVINNYEKINTPEAQKMKEEFIKLRDQINQLLLAGVNSRQAGAVVQNISATLDKIRNLWLADSKNLASQILNQSPYKERIKLSRKEKELKDMQDAANGQFIVRTKNGEANSQQRGDDGDYYAPQVLNPGVLKAMKYLADQGFTITVNSLIRNHIKYVHGKGKSIPDHWYGLAFDVATKSQEPGSDGDKLINALLNAPSEIRPAHIYGYRPDSTHPGGVYQYVDKHNDHIHVSFYGK